jgi:preprotein translocase subunit SecF
MGFSVNDNAIISERIQESRRKNRSENLPTLINRSINNTLSRTVINSGTVVLTTAALLVLGGRVVHSFAFVLLAGFVIETYSPIFVSTPIVLYMEGGKEGLRLAVGEFQRRTTFVQLSTRTRETVT